jgi:putative acetyltransferase
MLIRIDDLSGPEIRALLAEHLEHMHEMSPPESVHALDIDGLRRPDITFWSAWEGAALLGCGALRELDPTQGEIKSMRTSRTHLRRGTARLILAHIVETGRARRYERLNLETGSMDGFVPARRLYESFGFTYCPPFGDYAEDPHSVFMTLTLRHPA